MHDLKVAPWPYAMVEDWEAYWQEGLAKDAWRQQFEANETSCKPMGMVDIQKGAAGSAAGTQ
jgi:hypothetical protein